MSKRKKLVGDLRDIARVQIRTFRLAKHLDFIPRIMGSHWKVVSQVIHSCYFLKAQCNYKMENRLWAVDVSTGERESREMGWES